MPYTYYVPRNLWPKDITGARKVQEALQRRVRIIPLRRPPLFIAGVDASFLDGTVTGVASLYTYPDLMQAHDAFSSEITGFPYIPGFLSFREGPALVTALKKLKRRPDLLLFDGQGIAHPRGMGIATHLGIILNIPTIGCAKSRLVGDFIEPGKKRGSWRYLFYMGQKVGVVLRTRDGVSPIFVSPGHLIDIPSAIEIVMTCVSQFRIPEPLRRADHLSKAAKGFAS